MAATEAQQMLTYPKKTVKRAERSLLCSPFTVKLLETMQTERVPISAIALAAGVENGYTKRPLSELAAENDLLWLIEVGVLRRDVDGQGITDSFRVTPLGRRLIENQDGWQNPTWSDRISNTLSRWLRLPF